MLQTLTHNYYSIIDPPNMEELLDAVENANLMDEQEFTWTDGCLIEVERLKEMMLSILLLIEATFPFSAFNVVSAESAREMRL